MQFKGEMCPQKQLYEACISEFCNIFLKVTDVRHRNIQQSSFLSTILRWIIHVVCWSELRVVQIIKYFVFLLPRLNNINITFFISIILYHVLFNWKEIISMITKFKMIVTLSYLKFYQTMENNSIKTILIKYLLPGNAFFIYQGSIKKVDT